MNKKPEELDERIDHFLQAEEKVVGQTFQMPTSPGKSFPETIRIKAEAGCSPFGFQDWPHVWLSFSFGPSTDLSNRAIP